jgi:hypothetical protein
MPHQGMKGKRRSFHYIKQLAFALAKAAESDDPRVLELALEALGGRRLARITRLNFPNLPIPERS